jgi:hypothetical protein
VTYPAGPRCQRCATAAVYRVAYADDPQVPVAWACAVDLGSLLAELRYPDIGWRVERVL